jgi:two-component sensor histidine kinase
MSPSSVTLLTSLLSVAVTALAVGICAVGLGLWSAQRKLRQRDAELAQWRRTWQAHCEQSESWHWRSDREHRLLELRPPGVGSAADTRLSGRQVITPSDSALPAWQGMGLSEPQALEQRMRARNRIEAMPVECSQETGAPWRGLLRAIPCTDAQGEFDGYIGTLRHVAPPDAAATPEAAIPANPAHGEVRSGERVPTPLGPPGENPPAPARSEAAEAFSYTISHDLRAPLRVVEGFSKILKEDYGRALDRIGNDHLDRILAASQRMHNMIDSLLSLSRLSSKPLERRRVDLSALANTIVEELRRENPSRGISVVIEPGLQAEADATLLHMALENLLSNAWKYTGKRAQAEIRLTRHPRQSHTFTVSDNGAGFDMRFSDRLFCAFQRLHSASDFPGHGVGLASVKRIIQRHGGTIWAESEVGRGAQFHFSLPAPETSRKPVPMA